jgi:hypothetical protein
MSFNVVFPGTRAAMLEAAATDSYDRAAQLASSSSVLVRAALAANKRTPVGILIHLARDSHAAVREASAANPGVFRSPASIVRLMRDDSSQVRRALVLNPHVPVAILESACDPSVFVDEAVA